MFVKKKKLKIYAITTIENSNKILKCIAYHSKLVFCITIYILSDDILIPIFNPLS